MNLQSPYLEGRQKRYLEWYNGDVIGFDSKYIEEKLASFPIFLEHVGPSLIERGNCDNWYENGFIFDIYTDLDFVERFEGLLSDVNSVIDMTCPPKTLPANQSDQICQTLMYYVPYHLFDSQALCR